MKLVLIAYDGPDEELKTPEGALLAANIVVPEVFQSSDECKAIGYSLMLAMKRGLQAAGRIPKDG